MGKMFEMLKNGLIEAIEFEKGNKNLKKSIIEVAKDMQKDKITGKTEDKNYVNM